MDRRKEKRNISFPKDFFQKARPTISNEETLKSVIPIKWKKEKKSQNSKVIVYSANEKVL